MSEEYIIQTTATQRVETLKDTEPAIEQLVSARSIRKAREEPPKDATGQLLSDESQLESIAQELRTRFGSFRHQIFEIGRLFCEARECLKKTRKEPFNAWVERNFDLCGKTATNYMRVFHCCVGRPEIVQFFPPTSMYVICSDKFPKDLREALFDHAKGIIPPEKKELTEVALRMRHGELSMQSPEVQAMLVRQKGRDDSIIFSIELKSLKRLLSDRQQRFLTLAYRRIAHPFMKSGDHGHLENHEEDVPRERIKRMFENFTNDVEAELKSLSLPE